MKFFLSASVGLRTLRLPLHSDYLRTINSCTFPLPATMAEREEQRDAELLWKKKPCYSAQLCKLAHPM